MNKSRKNLSWWLLLVVVLAMVLIVVVGGSDSGLKAAEERGTPPGSFLDTIIKELEKEGIGEMELLNLIESLPFHWMPDEQLAKLTKIFLEKLSEVMGEGMPQLVKMRTKVDGEMKTCITFLACSLHRGKEYSRLFVEKELSAMIEKVNERKKLTNKEKKRIAQMALLISKELSDSNKVARDLWEQHGGKLYEALIRLEKSGKDFEEETGGLKTFSNIAKLIRMCGELKIGFETGKSLEPTLPELQEKIQLLEKTANILRKIAEAIYPDIYKYMPEYAPENDKK